MKIIDLFSGVGGFSLGAKLSNKKNEVVLANELDSQIAKSFQKNSKNTKVIIGSIKEVKKQLVYKNVDVIIGGPPCQGFSAAGKRNRKNFKGDDRNTLFRDYLDVVEINKPKYIIMENVPGIVTMNNGKIIEEITTKLKKIGYSSEYKIVNAVKYGVAQERKRFILFAVKNEVKKSFNFFDVLQKYETKTKTLKDAIYDLYENDISGNSKKEIPNHIHTNHSKKAIAYMKHIKPGENKDILIKKGLNIKSVHSGAYGRATWDEPCKTLITRFDTPSSGRYIHPVFNRTFTLREAARIQSFPDNFIFYGNKSSIIKQIGNAVPPILGKAIFNALEDYNERI